MLRLPTLTAQAAEWRLPLPDQAAVQLLTCLFAPSQRRRVECLSQTLKGYPSFLVWVVCRDAAHAADPPETIGQLANRFSPELLSELNWSDAGRSGNRWLSSSEKRWASLTERSLRVAELAATMAGETSASSGASRRQSGQAYLLGLLHGACDWLSSCGPAVRVSRGATRASPLPDWLVRSLQSLQLEADDGGAIAVVRQAVAQCATRGDEHAVTSPAADGKQKESADECCLVGAILPQVVTTLRRLEQLESRFEATLEQEKLESLREFAYGASHEINNPLANISTRAQTLLREETNPEKRRRLATINAQAFRAHEMISDMMLFAKPPELVPELVEVQELVRASTGELQPQADQQGTKLVFQMPPVPVMFEGDRVQLIVALRSLCVNALEALGSGGTVEIRVGTLPASAYDEEPWVEISVADNGPGIPPHVRRHLFDPFFSGREAGRGLGLGLSKCWRIVTLHGGCIDVVSQAGQGAVFSIRLPRRPGAAPPAK
jgi:signal transduction histidine kinase